MTHTIIRLLLLAGLVSAQVTLAQPAGQAPLGLALRATATERESALAALASRIDSEGIVESWPTVEAWVGRNDLPPEFRSTVLRTGIAALRKAERVELREPALALFQSLVGDLPAGTERSTLKQSAANLEVERGHFAESEALTRAAITEAGDRPLMERANLISGLGVALAQQGRLDEALDAMLTAHRYEQQSEGGPTPMLMMNIGALSIYIKNWEQAAEYSRRAIEGFGEDHPRTPSTYNNLAAALIEQKKLDEAEAALKQGIAIAEQQGRSVNSLNNNLGYLLRERGRLPDALEQFRRSAEVASEARDLGSLAIAEKNIGETLIALGQREAGAESLERALAFYRDEDIKPKRLELYPVMVENLESLGRYPEALERMREWRELAESLASADVQTRVAELQSVFDLGRREQELAALQAEQQRQTLVRWGLLAGVAVLALFLAMLFRSLRQRTLANRLLAEKNTEIEVQRRALAEANASLHRQSAEDELTGLGNRRSVRQWLEEAAPGSAATTTPWLLVLIDLDHFKAINDRHGHPVGDRVLAEFAHTLRAVASPADRLVRWGGEEFLWMIANATVADAPKRCSALTDATHRLAIHTPDAPLSISCSMGATALVLGSERQAEAFDRALKIADAALYEAKKTGRDTWVVFDRRSANDSLFDGSLDINALVERGALATTAQSTPKR